MINVICHMQPHRSGGIGRHGIEMVRRLLRRPGIDGKTRASRWQVKTISGSRRQAVEHVRDTLGRDVVTERRACRVLGQARTRSVARRALPTTNR